MVSIGSLGSGGNQYGLPTSDLDHILITHPAGGWQNDLVARIHQSQYALEQRLFGARSHADLRCIIPQAVILFQLFLDRGTQIGDAGDGGILGKVLINGRLGSALDVVRSMEIRFPDVEFDYIHAIPDHLRHLGVQLNGRRWSDTICSCTEHTTNLLWLLSNRSLRRILGRMEITPWLPSLSACKTRPGPSDPSCSPR